MRKKIILVLLELFCLGSVFMQDFHDADIEDLNVTISANRIKKTVVVLLKITNLKNFEVYIPKYNIDGINVTNDWFNVSNQKKKLGIYKGVMMKRPAPTIEQCIKLLPSESISFEVDLSKYYFFPLFTKQLSITYDGPLGESNTVFVNFSKCDS